MSFFDEDDELEKPSGPGPCPLCGARTELKTNKSLKVPFYGCVRFPACKGNRDYAYAKSPSNKVEVYDAISGHIHRKSTNLGDARMKSVMDNFGNKMMDRFFKKVDGVVWDLMSGKIGIMTTDGITTLDGEGEDAQINLNMIEQFGMPIPAFAQSTSINDVKLGDLIYANGKPKGWVIEIKEITPKVVDGEEPKASVKKFVIMTPSGTSSTWTPPKVTMLGFDSGVMVLKSLTNMLPGGESGLVGMQGSLMPLLMMGGGNLDGDMEKILPMLLMSQMGVGGAGAGAGASNMIQAMMMMKMMGGKGGSFFD